MNALWSYLWPCFAAGLLAGVIAGAIGFRRRLPVGKDKPAGPPPESPESRRRSLIAVVAGLAASIAITALWTGPIGGADRFVAQVEPSARRALDYYEMPKIRVHLHRAPLTRRLVLAGPADDFQARELARLMSQLPGVSRAQWTPSPAGPPLLLEGAAVSVLGLLLGLLLAYLVELRRRYNAQWTW